MPLDSKAFEIQAEKTLHDIFEQIDDALGDVMDVDLEAGILTIELENGSQYVINKQAPNQEIWLSSPLSGAKHFYFDEHQDTWIDTRAGEKLNDLLSNEMTTASGTAFSFKFS
ncbi:MAG: iron donor protein CyaY [Rhodospirillaceae bacterium]|jgi:frataxin|nr:iron donor protein CyaY [Rhodospirillaceae bacterium]MBT5245607.1 iron donor protein CyaY [Rhodospirillaceae bacterium]MBT5561145.1 iron donor protein CyaY [Rhodospirillaceae bacterium]MBT6242841.1 iron donor protein CyaY [Rhodospirillaceae bacterium]MBT7138766.1 iron donor protein CyaY [Rhodospirillaceae bacterium]